MTALDTISLEPKVPLPGPNANRMFRAKLSRSGMQYRITNAGRLQRRDSELVPGKSTEAPWVTTIEGAVLEEANPRWTDTLYHGKLPFHDDQYKYVAQFSDGQLASIIAMNDILKGA